MRRMKKPKSQIYLSDEVRIESYKPGDDCYFFPVRVIINDYNGDVYEARLTHYQIHQILRTATKIEKED